MYKIHHYLNEIRIRSFFLLFSFFMTGCIIYFFIDEFFYIFTNFFFQIKGTKSLLGLFNSELNSYFIFTDIPEAFRTSISLAFGFSFYLHIPFFIYQLWSFSLPSLFVTERKVFSKFCIYFFFLYILGSFFIYSLIFPLLSNFFFNFQTNNEFFNIHCEPRISSYISFILKISLISQLIFQLPFFISIFFYFELFNISDIFQNRRIIYWFILLFCAFFAPPDFFVQFFLSFCFIFLLESIFFLLLLFQEYRAGRA